MTFSMGPIEDDIIARIKTVISRVYVTEVPSDITPTYPLVVCYFGGPLRTIKDHGMRSVRSDTLLAYLTVQIISLSDTSARDIADLIRDKLLGYIPVNSGEMIPEGGLGYSKAAVNAAPVKYYRELAFTFTTNLAYNN